MLFTVESKLFTLFVRNASIISLKAQNMTKTKSEQGIMFCIAIWAQCLSDTKPEYKSLFNYVYGLL